MSLEKCPVCSGRGLVPEGFYGDRSPGSNTVNLNPTEKCRACNGKGVIKTDDSDKLSESNGLFKITD